MKDISNTWKLRYLDLAKQISTWSKDPSTKVGAVVVGSKGQILSQGYNGFPRGISDLNSRLVNKEVKHSYVVHAELNAIYNASYNGVSLDGATLYVSGLPICSECTKGIIQVGIKHVVMWNKDYPEKWMKSFYNSREMLKEAGIAHTFVKESK